MANSFLDDVIRTRKEQSNSIPAQRLIEKLTLVKTHIETYQRRWFWELLQNASDYNSSVDIITEISDSHITFTHNGEPFSIKDMLNLVRPDSNKINDPEHADNIGRFGSGLVSTHILSSLITISGIVKQEDDSLRNFNVVLDRFCYTDKNELIKKIEETNNSLDASYSDVSNYKPGTFTTKFVYDLTKPLPGIPRVTISDDDLTYLYDVLPYTMCFLRKVKSVKIIDNRTGKSNSFYIKQFADEDGIVKFSTKRNETEGMLSYRIFTHNKAQTVLSCDDVELKPYPAKMPKFFCGLPMVGTETIGLPIIINSLSFEPTSERDAIELVPSQNEDNRSVLKDSVMLYEDVLKYINEHKIKRAYHIANLKNKYNCKPTTASNQQFFQLFVSPVKNLLQNAMIVENREGNFIKLADTHFTCIEDKFDERLYALMTAFDGTSLPVKDECQHWIDALDFSLIPQKYALDNLIKDINANKKNIKSISVVDGDSKKWLYDVVKYAREKDKFVTSRFKLLPAQDGDIKIGTNLYHDDNIPSMFKELYNTLRTDKIEAVLLDPMFDDLDAVTNIKTPENIGNVIDKELSEKYKQNNSNPQTIIDPIRRLYNWIKEQQEGKKLSAETLRKYFPWFYPKQATLIVDCLSDNQRDQALIIAQCKGLDALATMAESFTPEQLQFMKQNIDQLKQLYDKSNSEKLQVKTERGLMVDVSLSDSPYAGLSKAQMSEALCRAKEQVVKVLKNQGFKTEEASGLDGTTYGNVYGVKYPDGSKCPLVVHSYRSNVRNFALTALDWEQLAQPNSLLYVVTNEGPKCIPFYKLMENRGIINLSFSTSNVDSKERMIVLADLLRSFKGMHFNFGTLLPSCTSLAEKFNQPAKEMYEKLSSDSESIMF